MNHRFSLTGHLIGGNQGGNQGLGVKIPGRIVSGMLIQKPHNSQKDLNSGSVLKSTPDKQEINDNEGGAGAVPTTKYENISISNIGQPQPGS
jgi:hypothetical protein